MGMRKRYVCVCARACKGAGRLRSVHEKKVRAQEHTGTGALERLAFGDRSTKENRKRVCAGMRESKEKKSEQRMRLG